MREVTQRYCLPDVERLAKVILDAWEESLDLDRLIGGLLTWHEAAKLAKVAAVAIMGERFIAEK